jgi:hypothetical protein
MTAITAAPAATPHARPRAPARPSRPAAWATLARRRISLSAHTPREILAPLATPLLFALVIAPALAKIIQAAGGGGADYSTFVIVGTVGLLIPLTCTFAGIGVIVDRATGARRELLTAPIPRAVIVLGNMAVAITVPDHRTARMARLGRPRPAYHPRPGAAALRRARPHRRRPA